MSSNNIANLEARIETDFSSPEILQKSQILIDELISTANVDDLHLFVTKLLSTNNEISNNITRQILLTFAKNLKNLQENVNTRECFETIANYTLTCIKNQPISHDESDYILRNTLFEHYISSGEYTEAAQILAGVNLDSTTRLFSDEEKVDILVKISEVYLEDIEHVEKAENFVSKASVLMNNITDMALQLRYRTTSARVLDLNRKFVDAAQRFYELSTMQNMNIEAGDLLELLGKAVTCVVLGKVGQPRSRVMALLYKDDRLPLLDDLALYSSHSAILTKMFNEQILKYSELQAFEQVLMPHQKSLTPDNFTLAQKAVIEHNIVAIGKIYNNIYISELAYILHLEPSLAEKVASKMITEERLHAYISQSENLLEFVDTTGNEERFDVRQICNDVTLCESYLVSRMSE